MHSHFTLFTQNVVFKIFQFCQFPPIFVLLKLTCPVKLFDSKLQVFQNSLNWTIFWAFSGDFSSTKTDLSGLTINLWFSKTFLAIFGIFNELLST